MSSQHASISHLHPPWVLAEVKNKIAWITLNRPETLNALDLTMTQMISQLLNTWQRDSSIIAVVIQGKGRAFCAGGDLRHIYELYHQNQYEKIYQFFQQEYELNQQIHFYPKPYIAILNGLTMGGGMGLSLHASQRIVTENALLAMPETGIGFFPDVGASYFLPQCPGSIGLYLGLTGRALNPREAVDVGLATHYIPQPLLANLLERLKNIHTTEEITAILREEAATAPQENRLFPYKAIIDHCFYQKSLAAIFQALEEDPTDFAQETLAHLKTRSPFSLKMTFEHFVRAQHLSFEEIMKKDYELSKKMLHSPDLIEGIRACVIDKDRHPKWQMIEI